MSVHTTQVADRGERASQTIGISVCICTFKRPAEVQRLLNALAGQTTEGEFSFDIVVIDNDRYQSARTVVENFHRGQTIPVIYDCEPEQNISLSRNRAIRHATGGLVALIDDDELPRPDWLLQLHRTLKSTAADGVLAPVEPDFPAEAPRWLLKAGVYARRRLPTGAVISAVDARTGNALLRKAVFLDRDNWFDPAFGRTGGEDSDFFRRQFALKRRFVWCDEALVTETVPPSRWTVAFHLRRHLRSGTLSGEMMRARKLSRGGVVKNVGWFLACLPLGLAVIVMPTHIRMRVWQKLAYATGILTGFAGMSLLRDRD